MCFAFTSIQYLIVSSRRVHSCTSSVQIAAHIVSGTDAYVVRPKSVALDDENDLS